MSVDKAVGDVVEILQVYARERNVELVYRSSWKGYFLGDESDIRHLALNLILNAIQASPKGGKVYIELSAEKDNWVLSIRDEGEGIDPEEMSKIFIPFYQGRNKCDGTGLGLAIVDSIVKEYGGSIQVDSFPGKGSLFRVSVPISETF
jgi:two-component system NtrC family sensor kinase